MAIHCAHCSSHSPPYVPFHLLSSQACFVPRHSSNKIVLMDEVQNLVQPSAEIQKSAQRVEMLQKLKRMLATAKNTVLVGFTATPLLDGENSPAERLLDVIRGPLRNGTLSNEGFIAYFMATPSAVFPAVTPSGVPAALPDEMLRKVSLQNFAAEESVELDGDDKKKKKKKKKVSGNLAQYLAELRKEGGPDEAKLRALCSLGQSSSFAGGFGAGRPIQVLKGGEGKLLRCAFPSAPDPDLPWCNDRLHGYASKLAAVCDDLEKHSEKTLVLVHSRHGHKLLLRLLYAKYGDKVVGYPKVNANQGDSDMLKLLGQKHDSRAQAKGQPCACNLCIFNDKKANLRGEKARIIVADAKECSEGVSFFGVRRFVIVDVPSTAIEYTQRVGRAVRFMGHAGLPLEDRNVQIRIYQAELPAQDLEDDSPEDSNEDSMMVSEKSADERLVEDLRKNLARYQEKLNQLKQSAFDRDMWEENDEDVPHDSGDLLEDIDSGDLLEDTMEDAAPPTPGPPSLDDAPQAEPMDEVSAPAKLFSQTKYRASYSRDNDCATSEELWKVVEGVVGEFEDEKETRRFIKKLKSAICIHEDKMCKYEEIKDADDLAVVLWSSTERSARQREFCSYLNQSIRDDKNGKALVRNSPSNSQTPFELTATRVLGSQIFAAQLNSTVVGKFNDRSTGKSDQVEWTWPEGPDATHSWSTEQDVTWRGTALPAQHLSFFALGKKFRSNMFLATSFDDVVARNFMEQARFSALSTPFLLCSDSHLVALALPSSKPQRSTMDWHCGSSSLSVTIASTSSSSAT